MKKILISAVIIVGFAGYLWYQRGGSPEVSPSPSLSPVVSVSPTVSPTVQASTSVSPTASAVKTFNVSGKEYSFTPNVIRVKKGDTVKIVFNNTGGQHNWVIDQFNARTPVIGSGQTSTIQFVADKVGTFEYYCSVGSHRALGMKGNLIVE